MFMAHSQRVSRKASDIRRLERDDLPSLSLLLQRCFGSPPTAGFSSQRMLAWKYLAPSAADATSWVVERGGAIVAHAGVIRATLRGPGGDRVDSATVIDWAADVQAPGAGMALYRHAMRQAELTFLIGGTPATRVMADRLGFQQVLDAAVFTRWVRPMREFLRRPKDVRAGLRLAHGFARLPFHRHAPRRGWLLARVPRFDDAVAPVLASDAAPHAFTRHSVATLNHRLACPTRVMRAHILVRRGTVGGVAVSSIGDWDAKILFVQLDSSDARDWSAAYSLVTHALSREPGVCRVSAMTTVPHVQHALRDNHFWRGARDPVMFHDPAHRAARCAPIDLAYFDTDFDYYNA
jgi:hypothetical protein